MKLFDTLINKNSALLSCAFRPFFLLSAAYLIVFLVLRYLVEFSIFPEYLVENSTIIFSHEIVFGVGVTFLSGFLLTAFPAWTALKRVESNQLFYLLGLWCIARLSIWLAPLCGLWPALLFNMLFLGCQLLILAPAVVDKKHQRHRLFVYQLALLFTFQLAVYYFWISGNLPFTLMLLQASFAVLIILLLTILSRISVVIINNALKKYQLIDESYQPEPPTRNFAIAIILLYLGVDLMMPNSSVSGWLALAVAASVINILNDWHLPRVWRDIYFQAGYAIYLSIAAGFVFVGMNNIWGQAAETLLLTDLLFPAITLAIMLVMLVVGQKHSGRTLSYQLTIRMMIVLMVLLLLIKTPFLATFEGLLILPSIALIFASFALYLVMFKRFFREPRVDGKEG